MSIPCRNSVLLALIFAACLLPCHAKLGETKDQCITHFGQPLQDNQPDPSAIGQSATYFFKNGNIIIAVFLDGKVGSEMFFKSDKTDMSEAQKTKLLNIYAEGQTWAKQQTNDSNGCWFRGDGAVAVYDSKDHALVFETAAYFKLSQAKQQQSK